MFKSKIQKNFKVRIMITYLKLIIILMNNKLKKGNQDFYMKKWMQEYRKWFKEK